jgi:succinate dehydrogenase/fumarate reductase-like Fe-S protein
MTFVGASARGATIVEMAIVLPLLLLLVVGCSRSATVDLGRLYLNANRAQKTADPNLILVPRPVADAAMDAAACIGCGACVAACPNSAANLFTAAKVAHLNMLPQGQPERWQRVVGMVDTMEEFFGSCTNHGECEKACPKSISIDFIALMNRDYIKAKFKNRRLVSQQG